MGFNYKCGCRISNDEVYLCNEHKTFMFNMLEVLENKNALHDLTIRKKQELLAQTKDLNKTNYYFYCDLKQTEKSIKNAIMHEVKKQEGLIN